MIKATVTETSHPKDISGAAPGLCEDFMTKIPDKIKTRAAVLRKERELHNRLYYVDAAP